MTDRAFVLVGAAHAHTADHVRVAAEQGWRCAAVVDPDPDLRARWAEETCGEPAESLDAVAARASAAVVCGETARRAEEVGGALAHRLPTFSEKPLAPDADTAQALARRAEAAETLLDTGFFLRTNAALSTLRDKLRAGAIGRVHEARMRFAHDGGFADWLDLSGWMSDPERASYGGFGDEAIHALDWLSWTLGPPTAAPAALGHALGLPIDDAGVATLRFPDGAAGVLQGGWTDARMRLELDIVGEGGWAGIVDGRAAIILRGADAPDWSAPLRQLDAGEGLRPFLAAVEAGDRTGLVPPADAVAANVLLDALYDR